MDRALRNRLTFGPIMLIGLCVILLLDHQIERWTRTDSPGVKGVGLFVLLLLVTPLATRELTTLFAAEHVRPFRLISLAGSGSLLLHAFLTQFPFFKPIAASTLAAIVVGVMLLAALQRALTKTTQETITAMAGTVLSVLYLGGLEWFLLALRVKQGFNLHGEPFVGTTMHVLMILVVVKFTDIGAFFTGRNLGRRKLIPWLSPGKTWEGLVGGLVTAAVVGGVFAPWIVQLEWSKGAIFGILIGGIGQLGDLLESLMKRDADVKDSGKSIPGFGGILDVIDSPLLAAPFAYLLFSLF